MTERIFGPIRSVELGPTTDDPDEAYEKLRQEELDDAGPRRDQVAEVRPLTTDQDRPFPTRTEIEDAWTAMGFDPKAPDSPPTCEKCGAPIETGFLALFCPFGERCALLPDKEPKP